MFRVVQLDQGDLGLPGREYYLNKGAKNILSDYSDFIRGTAMALGGEESVVDRDVKDLVAFETEFAKVFFLSFGFKILHG